MQIRNILYSGHTAHHKIGPHNEFKVQLLTLSKGKRLSERVRQRLAIAHRGSSRLSSSPRQSMRNKHVF